MPSLVVCLRSRRWEERGVMYRADAGVRLWGDALPIETVAAQPSRAEAATEIPVDMVHGPGVCTGSTTRF
jgi:hypothetical protein|uniref:Uncharacterized protein n=1 Tax=Zea mays TaxID=4577 RepID=B7ZZ44_MAIZE|nr:unknown [Zea mays]